MSHEKITNINYSPFCRGGITNEQSALEFDGQDDFAEIHAIWPTHGLLLSNQTFEVIFRDLVLGKYNWFVSQYVNGNNFAIGINPEGIPIVNFNEQDFVLEEASFEDGGCHQLSVVFENEDILWYLEGRLVGQTSVGQPIGFDAYEYFTIGNNLYHDGDHLEVIIEDMRLFADIRTTSEIFNNRFHTIQKLEDYKFFNFSFDQTNINWSQDQYFTHRRVHLGGSTHISNQKPKWTFDDCILEPVVTESVAPCSGYSPTLILPGPTELVINGDFEQYCSFLSTVSSTTLPEEAYVTFGSGFTPDSDVANWESSSGTCDFYVNDGIGDNVPNSTVFTPYFPLSGGNWFATPPTMTHNGLGTAYSGMVGSIDILTSAREQLTTILKQNLSSNKTYQFQAWTYVPGVKHPGSNTTTNSSALEISISDGTTTTIVNANLSVPYTGNVVGNNGWSLVSFSFNTGVLPIGTNILTIKNVSGVLATEARYSYVFIDDVSLKEVTQGQPVFPSFIGTSQLPDGFKCQIKVDSNDDVIVMGQVQNSPLGTSFQPSNQSSSANASDGYFIAKYSEDGALLWQKLFPFLTCNGFDVDANDDIYCVGAIAGTATSTDLPSMTVQTNYHWPDAVCPSLNSSINMFVQKLSGTTGVEQMLKGYGGKGHEDAKDIVIEGNNAYIAVDMSANDVVAPAACAPPHSFTTYQGSIRWGSGTKGGNAIVKANVNSGFIEVNLPALFSINNSISIDSENGAIFLLTSDKLYRYSTSLTQTATPQGVSNQNYLHVNDGKVYTLGAHSVTQRNVSNLNSNWTKTYSSSLYTKAVTTKSTSSGHEVVVSLVNHANTNCAPVCDQLLRIEKLASNSGSMTWSKETTHTNSVMTNYGSGYRELDIDCFSNNDKFAFLAGFQPKTTGSWNIQLDSKSLSGTGNGQPTPDQNFIVSTIEDLGSTGQFKQGQAVLGSEETLVYPNPFFDVIYIEAFNPITSVSIIDAMGRTVMQSKVESKEVKLDVSSLKHGFYSLVLNCVNSSEVYKIVK